jgi:peptidoglycan/xylan/chitin deacetylase (PgdA/CDA1 family)
MYHRFSQTPQSRRLDVTALRQQLEYLARHCSVLSLDELISGYRSSKALPKHAVVVTVDDGYEDFYRYAWPEFKAAGIPVILYVTTEFIDQSIWLWPDRVRYILEQAGPQEACFSWRDDVIELSLTSGHERERTWHWVAEHCLAITDDEKHQLIDALADKLGVVVPPRPVSGYRACSWEQLREMQHEGLFIGAHTCTHPKLTSLTPASQAEEIIESKRQAQMKLNKPVEHFCYPNGAAQDFDARTLDIVRTNGFKSAVVGFHDGASPAKTMFELRRIGVDHDWQQFVDAARGLITVKDMLKHYLPRFMVNAMQKLSAY